MPIEKKIVGKGENAGNQHFLLYAQCFLPYQRQIPLLEPHSDYFLQMPLIWISLYLCPSYRKIGGILFYHCPSVCPSVCQRKL